MAMSEKSRSSQRRYQAFYVLRTLRIQEVGNQDAVSLIGVNRGVFEHLIDVAVGSDAHVLLAESAHVGVDIDMILSRHQVSDQSRRDTRKVSKRTSCSERGIF
jgi:hypothetical protein